MASESRINNEFSTLRIPTVYVDLNPKQNCGTQRFIVVFPSAADSTRSDPFTAVLANHVGFKYPRSVCFSKERRRFDELPRIALIIINEKAGAQDVGSHHGGG